MVGPSSGQCAPPSALRAVPLAMRELVSTRRGRVAVAAFSIPISLSYAVGNFVLDTWNPTLFVAALVPCAALAAAAFVLMASLGQVVRGKIGPAGAAQGKAMSGVGLRAFGIAMAAILLCWLFSYALYYPCCASNDSSDILKMALGLPFESDRFRYDTINNHHPVLYTALVALFVQAGAMFGDVTFGIGMFTLFQMVLLASACSYAVAWLYARTGLKAVFILAAAFFSLNPLIARYAVTLWKDALFAGSLLLYLLLVADVLGTRGECLGRRRTLCAFLVLSALVMLFRNNGVFVVAATVVVLALLCPPVRRRLATAGLGIVVGLVIVQNVLFGMLGIVSGHASESFSIPLQQIARTVVEDGAVTEDQRSFIEGILPIERIKELYLPESPNPLKFAPDFNDAFLDSHKLEFLAVWAAMLPSNLGSYVRAWCDETVGYWRIGVDNWLVADPGYYLDDTEEPLVQSLLPEWFLTGEGSPFAGTALVDGARARLYPLFNMGCMVWFMLFTAAASYGFGRVRLAAVCAPFIAYWLTLLIAAPTACEFRYLFALHVALPVIAVLWLCPVKGWLAHRALHPASSG